jgi:ribosome biogenesis protein ENP2
MAWLCRYDGDYRRRLELIQDTKFPVACQRVKTSRDGRFLFATGTYPPQIKVYELSQLSMKFERHLDAQIVQFQACVIHSFPSFPMPHAPPHTHTPHVAHHTQR